MTRWPRHMTHASGVTFGYYDPRFCQYGTKDTSKRVWDSIEALQMLRERAEIDAYLEIDNLVCSYNWLK